ncbi:hypothetical protein GOBAR_AA25332 [Gossypium barbadense]|uniref:SREBP regulating gene protein n=1 Tax=Gossypium barbadense TaxID=3634 RepID=A0A2P5WWA4_GOSBA|nr:hypothetical protein GOBAR_AA25332 [Gossypium barbadense]
MVTNKANGEKKTGYVCDALSLDPQYRCCPERGDKFSCHGCNVLSQCCNSYEFCVSCCLQPAQTQKEQVLKLKVAKPSTSGTYLSVFDFCAGRCGHNSESVVHENAYVSDFHHCFSLPSNSSALGMKRKNGVKSEKKERNRGNCVEIVDLRSTISPVEARLNGINVVIGRQGESCDSVCKSNGQSCVLNKLLILNQCDIVSICLVDLPATAFSIQKYMSCKGACLASVGPDQPAEVVDDAPKNLEHACILEHNQCYLVMVLIGIPGDFVPVHSASPCSRVESCLKSGYLFPSTS